MKQGKVFIICGPSGAGKGTLLSRILQDDPTLFFSVSATTRAPREKEIAGVHYHFIEKEAFEEMIAAGELLEYAAYVGNYYGTPAPPVRQALAEQRDVLLDIEIQGAGQIMSKYPDAIRIYIAPPSWEELERRLVARNTETANKIQSRLEQGRVEFKSAGDFDYLIVNDDLETAVYQFKAILCAEHCKPADAMDTVLL